MKDMVENIRCPLCGKSNQKYVRSDNKLDIVVCNCGLYFVNPQPTHKYVKEFYNKSYYYDIKKNKVKQKKREIYLHVIVKKIIQKLSDKGSILDIGCGDGSLLSQVDQKKYQISGTEYSDIEIARALEVTKNIYKTEYLEYDARDKYNFIIMTEVLEHTKEPLKYLKKIHADLKKGGHIIITVPNNNWILMKGYKNNLITNLHLFYFNQKTLKAMLQKAGFKEVHQVMTPRVDYYENYFKTTIIQLAQISSYLLYLVFRINLGKNIIMYAKK
jgi:2-polyprenyl-3-methyl-5-hydroxy-6-metoxy-1,4-benzoquinol methylase